MAPKSAITPRPMDRRNFLLRSGSLGALLAGSTLSNTVMAENYAAPAGAEPDCSFNQLAGDFTYLNSGTEGSMPKCVLEDLQNNLQRWASDPTTAYEADETLGKRQHKTRADIAKILGVEKNNICLTDNTTMGLNMVLTGLSFTASDKVIVTNHEHNAILSPLTVISERIGTTVITRSFPAAKDLPGFSVAALMDHLFPNTPELRGAAALCVSHVYPTTGVRLPLDLLRKKADELGIRYLIVDGAQAFGMLDTSQGPEHITHCDFYACPGHKWLNGPPSTGILFLKNADIRPPEFYPMLSQRMYKYRDGNSNFPMAQALQVRGCSNAPGFGAMLRAMKFQIELGGASVVENHILGLSASVKAFIHEAAPLALVSPAETDKLQSGLTVFFPFRWQSPNTLFTDKKTCDLVVDRLLEKNIQIRSIGFDDPSSERKLYALRVSTAIFTTPQQLNQFQAALQATLRQL